MHSMHQYEVRPRRRQRSVDQIHFARDDVWAVLVCVDLDVSHGAQWLSWKNLKRCSGVCVKRRINTKGARRGERLYTCTIDKI